MAKYPGLGLPLRHKLDLEADDLSYPTGVHSFCSGSSTLPLSVRELAMMSIMETLTDKDDWHTKVFDERIVAKWREEARKIPDEYFWDLAEAPGSGRIHAHPTESPARILNDKSFDYVGQSYRLRILSDSASASRSSRQKPNISKRPVLSQHLMHTQMWSNPIPWYLLSYISPYFKRLVNCWKTTNHRLTGILTPIIWCRILFIRPCIH
jgi:hypothetical protein